MRAVAPALVASLVLAVACVPRKPAPAPCTCPGTAASSAAAATPAPVASPAPLPSGFVASPAPLPSGFVASDATDVYETASEKMNAGDGKGCLAVLDAYDATGPKHPSTNASSSFAILRAQCHLVAGECQKGKALLSASYASKMALTMGPEAIEKSVEMMVVTYCRNAADLSPRERLLQALYDLNQGAYVSKKSVAECMAAYESVRALSIVVAPKDAEDTQIKDGPRNVYHVAARCLARAGDCKAARKVFEDAYPQAQLASVQDPAMRAKIRQQSFDALVETCAGTAVP